MPQHFPTERILCCYVVCCSAVADHVKESLQHITEGICRPLKVTRHWADRFFTFLFTLDPPLHLLPLMKFLNIIYFLWIHLVFILTLYFDVKNMGSCLQVQWSYELMRSSLLVWNSIIIISCYCRLFLCFQVRLEQVLMSESGPVVLYKLMNLIKFYQITIR